VHHAIEDQRMFPDLGAADRSLGPVLQRLSEQHEVIAGLLSEVDSSLVTMMADETRLEGVRASVDRLGEVLLAHLAEEEDQLLGPIGRLGIQV
jgi:hemerythrin-like domain-containing protein